VIPTCYFNSFHFILPFNKEKRNKIDFLACFIWLSIGLHFAFIWLSSFCLHLAFFILPSFGLLHFAFIWLSFASFASCCLHLAFICFIWLLILRYFLVWLTSSFWYLIDFTACSYSFQCPQIIKSYRHTHRFAVENFLIKDTKTTDSWKSRKMINEIKKETYENHACLISMFWYGDKNLWYFMFSSLYFKDHNQCVNL